MYASEFAPKEVVELLKSRGADAGAKDEKGLTAADYASEERKRKKYLGLVGDEIAKDRKYFIGFLNEKQARGTDEVVNEAYTAISPSEGHITLVYKVETEIAQKRVPFAMPFNERMTAISRILSEKYKDEAITGKITKLNNLLLPFSKKSDDIYSALANEAGEAPVEKRPSSRDLIAEYIDSYMKASEEINIQIKDIESCVNPDAVMAESAKPSSPEPAAPKPASPKPAAPKPGPVEAVNPETKPVEIAKTETAPVELAGNETAPVEIAKAGTEPVEMVKRETQSVEIRNEGQKANGESEKK